MPKEEIEDFLTDGYAIGPSDIDENSPEYRETLAILLERIKNRTPEEQFAVDMMSLEARMNGYVEANASDKTVKTVQDFYKELLDKANVSQKKLAQYIGYQPGNLSTMFKEGKVNYEVAKMLESIFGIPYSLWLDVQAKNHGNRRSGKRKKRFSDYSYKELMG